MIGQSESTSRSTCKSSVKKPTFKQTRPFQARMFQRNGRTGQIEQSLHGKSLAGKGEWCAIQEIIRGMHPPAFLLHMGSAIAEFMLRQDAGGFK